MVYQGKEVLTQDTFSYETAGPGDFVEQAVVDDAMNCMPPACMTGAVFPDGYTAFPPSGPADRPLACDLCHLQAVPGRLRRLGILRLLFPGRNSGAGQRARILLTNNGGNLCQF